MAATKILQRKKIVYGVFILCLLPGGVAAQISPGPLARAHAHLEGVTRCLSCHQAGKKSSNDRCLSCHTAIGLRLEQRRGLHAAIMAQEAERSCASCHSEHNGRDFALIFWEDGEERFDHRRAGFALEGKHAQVACRDCHQPGNIQEDFAHDATVRPAKTFLGVAQKCARCHGDEHRGQLGAACERCHDFSAWNPAAKFAHTQAQFLLTGRHKEVACAKCHPEKAAAEKVGREKAPVFVQYTGLLFGNCIPCHQDPHRGSFGNECAACHSTEGWRNIRSGSFNHDLTAFPLRGRHTRVACEKCHGSLGFKKRIAHAACRDCHQDAHAGQFAQRADQGKCESCHSVEGFSPALFTLAQHQRASFQLRGAHLATPCGQCHARQTAGALAGKLLFAFPRQSCSACHPDEHAGQFAARMANKGCEVCHVNEDWHQTKFEHNTARFALTGAHRHVPCEKCHPQEKLPERASAAQPAVMLPVFANASSAAFVRYRPLAFQCAECHGDVHRGQFGKSKQARCEKCHQATRWRDLLFVHNRDSAFKLEGAHEKARCQQCHFPRQLKDGAVVVIYKPLQQECAACHG